MTLLLALVIRLLSLLLSFENTHIVSGDLPSRLAGLPLPEGTRVVVSYVRRDSAIGFSAGVELNTPLAPDTFCGQMEWRLARGGWKPVRVPIPAIGPSLFESNDLPLPEPGLAGTPFFQKDGLTLTLNYPTGRPNRLTRAYFQVESGDKPIKSLLFYETTGPTNDLLPSLTVPKGSELGASSTSEDSDHLSASTAVTTNMSPYRPRRTLCSATFCSGLACYSEAFRQQNRVRKARVRRQQRNLRRPALGFSLSRGL